MMYESGVVTGLMSFGSELFKALLGGVLVLTVVGLLIVGAAILL